MIRIVRPEPPPASLLTCGAEQLAVLLQLVDDGRAPASKDFVSGCYGSSAVKDWLHRSQHRKCCFCERERGQWKEDVEHFRPKAEATRSDGSVDGGYWWLAYEPGNLFFSCPRCNQGRKKSHFPLLSGAPLPPGTAFTVGAEDAVFVHFLEEDPEDHLEFDQQDGRWILTWRSERGRLLLELMDLDGDALDEARNNYVANTLDPIRDDWRSAESDGDEERMAVVGAQVRTHTNGSQVFTLLARCYFRAAQIPF